MSNAAANDPVTRDLVVVGGGNMGAALISGMLASGAFEGQSIVVVEALADRRAELVALFPSVVVTDAIPACNGAVLAVKPPDIAAAASVAAAAGARRVLSIAAGIGTAALVDAVAGAGHPVAVLRAMPNTPSLVGEGMAALTGAPATAEADLVWAEQILTSVGACVRVDESLFDAVTALTGSGPAYVFYLAESLVAAGLDVGLPAELVETMVSQLLTGSAALLAQRGDPGALRAMVTSPGGTTAAGIARLEAHQVSSAVMDAVHAAAARSRELGA